MVLCDTLLFSKQFLRCIDLSLFSHCTTSHNAGHFLGLILSPCLVIRDNCQLSQGTIRSITTKSMQPLGLACTASCLLTEVPPGMVKRLVNPEVHIYYLKKFLGLFCDAAESLGAVFYSHV